MKSEYDHVYEDLPELDIYDNPSKIDEKIADNVRAFLSEKIEDISAEIDRITTLEREKYYYQRLREKIKDIQNERFEAFKKELGLDFDKKEADG
jgi:hypothetical protein